VTRPSLIRRSASHALAHLPPPFRSSHAGTRSVRLLPGSIRPLLRRGRPRRYGVLAGSAVHASHPPSRLTSGPRNTRCLVGGVAHTKFRSSAPFWRCGPHFLTARQREQYGLFVVFGFSLHLGLHCYSVFTSSLQSKWVELFQALDTILKCTDSVSIRLMNKVKQVERIRLSLLDGLTSISGLGLRCANTCNAARSLDFLTLAQSRVLLGTTASTVGSWLPSTALGIRTSCLAILQAITSPRHSDQTNGTVRFASAM
jgi:hypothetical protein